MHKNGFFLYYNKQNFAWYLINKKTIVCENCIETSTIQINNQQKLQKDRIEKNIYNFLKTSRNVQ